ncbi:hypothetical protein NA78x_006043 [Anatilimnocola sp. NA78]|uniref:hypothetical protein n=1 Tax=Anatilimnocola sp. NA78 TaxID=3415683 RepID=UPI003CE52053
MQLNFMTSSLLGGLGCALLMASSVLAQQKSLDEQLLDDLKPVPAKVKSPAKTKADQKPDGEKPADKLDDALRRELEQGEDIGQEKNDEHPLVKLGREMREVQQRIGAKDTAKGTQQMQRTISAQLAGLIEQAQKQPQGKKAEGNKPGNSSAQAGNESGSASSQPGQQSTQRLELGEETQAQMNEVKDALRRIWGHLPEKERDEMIGSLGEQFLPKYERLIEAFYKRLAERPAAGQ